MANRKTKSRLAAWRADCGEVMPPLASQRSASNCERALAARLRATPGIGGSNRAWGAQRERRVVAALLSASILLLTFHASAVSAAGGNIGAAGGLKLPWREVGPHNHHDDKVGSFRLLRLSGGGGANSGAPPPNIASLEVPHTPRCLAPG